MGADLVPAAWCCSTLLWHTALQHIPVKGTGYRAQTKAVQELTVARPRLEAYAGQHVPAPKEESEESQQKPQYQHRPKPQPQSQHQSRQPPRHQSEPTSEPLPGPDPEWFGRY